MPNYEIVNRSRASPIQRNVCKNFDTPLETIMAHTIFRKAAERVSDAEWISDKAFWLA